MIRRIALAAVALCVLVIGLALFGWWFMESKPVPESASRQVVSGLTKDAVRSILGEPASIYPETPGQEEQWVYGSRWQWNFYWITFSRNGVVEYADYGD